MAGASVGFESQLARAGAALVERGHRAAPTVGSHRAFGVGQFDLNELFGFGKSGGRDFRTHGSSRAKRGRLAGRQVAGGLGLGAESGCAQKSQGRGFQKSPARFGHATSERD